MMMSKAKYPVLLFSVFFVSAYGAKTSFFLENDQDGKHGFAVSPVSSDSICKSFVEMSGYACEEHTVTTKDGFILGLQRIPEGRSRGAKGTRLPVLLQHGIIMDGAVWVLGTPEKSLAFILADKGFDVWLANSRGTSSSLLHTSLSPTDPAYWDWSWDELVLYDLPATFQYLHNKTQQNLHYVAHSLGTLIALAAFSNDQLVNMLRSAVLLSPIAYLSNVTSPVVRIGADIVIANESYWLSVAQFDPLASPVLKLLAEICSRGVDCRDLLTAITGPNCCLDTSLFAGFINHGPQSSSTKNLIHLIQMLKEGTIAMDDYGDADENKRHYGQSTPPVYDMKKIPNEVPLFLGYGGADAVSDVKDVQNLLENLKDHAKDSLVVNFTRKYGHADFVFGVNAETVVYDPVVNFLKLH